MSLNLDIRVGETLMIGEDIRITLLEKSGRRARIGIDASASILIKQRRTDYLPEGGNAYAGNTGQHAIKQK